MPTARSSRAGSTSTSIAARRRRCVARRGPAAGWRCWACWWLDRFDTLDLGGGFPVGPLGQPRPAPNASRASWARSSRRSPSTGDRGGWSSSRDASSSPVPAGWWPALHVRGRPGAEVERQVVLDAGMTELIRPALYGARHEIEALTSPRRPCRSHRRAAGRALVEGPVCESTDHLGTHDLPPLRRGDLVAVRDAGAYAASLGSTYNGRPRPAQVLLEEDGSSGSSGGGDAWPTGLTTTRRPAPSAQYPSTVPSRHAVLPLWFVAFVAVWLVAVPAALAPPIRHPRRKRRPRRSSTTPGCSTPAPSGPSRSSAIGSQS